MTHDLAQTVLLVAVTVLTTGVAMMTAAAVTAILRVERHVRGNRVLEETSRQAPLFSGRVTGSAAVWTESGDRWIPVKDDDGAEVCRIVFQHTGESDASDALARKAAEFRTKLIVSRLNGET